MLQNASFLAIVAVDTAEIPRSPELDAEIVESPMQPTGGPRAPAHGRAGGGPAPAADLATSCASQQAPHSPLSEARCRLDQRRCSRPNTHFSAFFEIYKKIIFSQANFAKFLEKNAKTAKKSQIEKNQNFDKFCKFSEIFRNPQLFCKNFQNFQQNLG